MVYHSVPDPNKAYGDHMSNFELTKFEIHSADFTPAGLISQADVTVTSVFPRRMVLTRPEMIQFMKQQGSGFYYKEKKLILETVGLDQFIHFEKTINHTGPSCADCRPCDILE